MVLITLTAGAVTYGRQCYNTTHMVLRKLLTMLLCHFADTKGLDCYIISMVLITQTAANVT